MTQCSCVPCSVPGSVASWVKKKRIGLVCAGHPMRLCISLALVSYLANGPCSGYIVNASYCNVRSCGASL